MKKILQNFSSSRGFTMIELIVVFSVIGILTAVSIVSYGSYTNTQSFQSASADVISVLQTAKSRALSQVKPTACTGKTLVGYQVAVNVAASSYRLEVVCDGTATIIDQKVLPPNVTFANTSKQTTLFNVSTATVTSPGTIIINGFGKTKTITISPIGGVSAK